MPVIGLDVEARHLGVGDPYRLGVAVLIRFAAHRQTGFGRGGGDELNNRETADKRLSAPSLDDVAEHAMFDPCLSGSRTHPQHVGCNHSPEYGSAKVGVFM
jgi:hypothetical protein